MHAVVHAADIQDRDGGGLVMATLFGMFPFLLKLYADGGYQGPEFRRALKKILTRVNIEIVKRSDQAKGFVVLPKRWIVERTFAGSAVAVGSPRTGKTSIARRSPSYASLPSGSCCESYAIPHDVHGQTLTFTISGWVDVFGPLMIASASAVCARLGTRMVRRSRETSSAKPFVLTWAMMGWTYFVEVSLVALGAAHRIVSRYRAG